MPRKPKHPCSYPGCPNLTDGQYCEEHRKIARRQYDRYERQPDVGKKYGRAWKRIRDRYVQEHPFCERCFEEGRMTPVEEVHHIIPLQPENITDPSITLNEENLISLCRECHRARHGARERRYTVDEFGRVTTK